MRKIVLASESPRRKVLLESIDITFTIHPSNIDEELIKERDPHTFTKLLSKAKASEAAKHYEDAIIIAADTVVWFEGEILGKPTDKKDAKRILRKLRGKTHAVVTGCTVLDTKTQFISTMSGESRMTMKRYSDSLLDRYIASGHPLDKAGAYGYLGIGTVLVERIDGDYYSEVGLPLGFVIDTLDTLGVNVLPKIHTPGV